MARALERLDVPVVATGLAGGRHGHPDRRGADRGGDPQRLRADPGRVAHVDRGRRPDVRDVHRDQRVGPEGVAFAELEMLLEKLRYLARGASTVVFAGSLAAGCRRGLLRRCSAGGVAAAARASCSTPRASRCAGASRRSRGSSSPNQHEAEQLVGQELDERGRLPDGARHGSPRWGPGTSTSRWRRAASRSCARSARCGGTGPVAPQLEPVSDPRRGGRAARALARGAGSRSGRRRRRCGSRSAAGSASGAGGRRRALRPQGGGAACLAGRGRPAAARRVAAPAVRGSARRAW